MDIYNSGAYEQIEHFGKIKFLSKCFFNWLKDNDGEGERCWYKIEGYWTWSFGGEMVRHGSKSLFEKKFAKSRVVGF